MAQQRTMTMTWIVLGALCRRLPVVRLLRDFERPPQGTGLLPSSRKGSLSDYSVSHFFLDA